MTERWQSELVKLRRAELGANLWDRIAEGPRLEPPPPPAATRSRALAATVAFAVFIAAAALVWNVFRPFETEPATLGGSRVVRVPPRGEAQAFFLPDGEPVFVVHHRDGLVVAVDALSPHRDWGIEQVVAWCPSKHYFVAWPDGSFFDRSGSWKTGRPAVPGLDSVAFEVLTRDASGAPETLRLGRVGAPWGAGHGNITSRPPVPAAACGLADGDYSQIVTHSIDGSKVWPSPAAAARADTADWMAVEGTLLVSPDGSARLCSEVDGNTCRNGARVLGVGGRELFHKLQVEPTSPYAQPHTWLVRADDGAFVEIALPPG
jgi:hypothetical protein